MLSPLPTVNGNNGSRFPLHSIPFRAIAIAPDFGLAYAYLGKAYSYQGDVCEMRKCFDEADKRAPAEFRVVTLRYIETSAGEDGWFLLKKGV